VLFPIGIGGPKGKKKNVGGVKEEGGEKEGEG